LTPLCCPLNSGLRIAAWNLQWFSGKTPSGGSLLYREEVGNITLEDGGLVHAFASRKHPSAAAPVLKVKTQ
jgi:hypothetical protein